MSTATATSYIVPSPHDLTAVIRGEAAVQRLRAADLAQAAGLSSASMSARLHDRVPLTWGEVAVIARRLDLTVAELVARAEEWALSMATMTRSESLPPVEGMREGLGVRLQTAHDDRMSARVVVTGVRAARLDLTVTEARALATALTAATDRVSADQSVDWTEALAAFIQ